MQTGYQRKKQKKLQCSFVDCISLRKAVKIFAMWICHLRNVQYVSNLPCGYEIAISVI